MLRARVVVLSGRSLFAEGVASRLRKYTDQIDLHYIDFRQSGALAQLIEAKPSVIILDASDPEVEQHCPLGAVLEALPSSKVLRLDPQQDQIQVVTSEQRPATEVSDLIDLIGS